jgi:hypothetical protein
MSRPRVRQGRVARSASTAPGFDLLLLARCIGQLGNGRYLRDIWQHLKNAVVEYQQDPAVAGQLFSSFKQAIADQSDRRLRRLLRSRASGQRTDGVDAPSPSMNSRCHSITSSARPTCVGGNMMPSRTMVVSSTGSKVRLTHARPPGPPRRVPSRAHRLNRANNVVRIPTVTELRSILDGVCGENRAGQPVFHRPH